MIFRELKTMTGRVRTDQRHVIGILTAIGEDVGIWRPDDLTSGRIVRELTAISRPRLQPADIAWLTSELNALGQRCPDAQMWQRCKRLMRSALMTNLEETV